MLDSIYFCYRMGVLFQTNPKNPDPSYMMVVVVVVLLFYIHGKHLRSWRDGQLT